MKTADKIKFGIVMVVVAALAFADVSLIAKKQHTKVVTVTHTKVVKVKVPVRVQAAPFDGTIRALAAYLHPETGNQVKCPKGINGARVDCFQLFGQQWFVLAAVAKR